MGTAIAINFQSAGDGRAATTGDFVLLPEEVNPVLRTLRINGIEVTALHTHMLDEQPRLYFMHFWGADQARRSWLLGSRRRLTRRTYPTARILPDGRVCPRSPAPDRHYRGYHYFIVAIIISAVSLSAGPTWAQRTAVKLDFEGPQMGSVPPGFSPGLTGKGTSPVWKVVDDPTAPAGPRVVAETSSDRTNDRFPC